MKVKKSTALGLVLAVAAVAGLVVGVNVASGVHARPAGATPVLASTAIAYKQCPPTGTNRIHGGGLPFNSCNPAVQNSPNITVGTPGANGAPAQGRGSLRIDVCPTSGCAAPNVKLQGHATDIRCKSGTVACGSANAVDGADYTGELQGNATIRITDHLNDTPAPSCGTSASCKTATVIDIPFPVNTSCTATPDTGIGSNCDVVTTANATVPGAVVSGAQGNVEIGQLQVTDGGADGAVGSADNSLFAVQGIFIP